MTGQSFIHAKRGSMTGARVARIFQAAGGRCHICKRKLGPADHYEIDHVIALSKGGSDDDSNLAPACEWCHDAKSDRDTSDAAKGKRMVVKHVVPKAYRQKGRGWR